MTGSTSAPFPITPTTLSEARWLIDEVVRHRAASDTQEMMTTSVEHRIALLMAERDHWKALAEARLASANKQLKGRRAMEAEAQFAHDLVIQQSTLFKKLGAEKAVLAEKLNKLQTMWDHVAALARQALKENLL